MDRGQLEVTVVTILEMVRSEGDAALIRYSKEFDRVEIENFQVSEDEFHDAITSIPADLKDAIRVASKNIEKFHSSQIQSDKVIETMPGVKCWKKSTAIEKVGLYIPGGSAPLYSTLLMLGIPARLAGCEEIVVCTPPTVKGTVDRSILYVANELGIKKVYKTGGAQAIAAMTFGTETIPGRWHLRF